MKSLKFGVGLFPTKSLARMIDLARLSEELQFTHIWVGDSHLIWREAYVNLAAMALNTSKVKLGTGVTNPLTRHPSVLASTFATLAEMDPERFIIGIGLGDSSLETMGMKPARLAHFEKAISDIRSLVRGDEVELATGSLHLKHGQQTKVPIFIAASGPKMLELSGRIADGVIILVGTEPAYVQQAIEKIQVGARSCGRDPQDLELVLWVPCAVSQGPGAKDAVKAHVARVLAHPLPFTLDEKQEEVLQNIRRVYNYYQHMEQKARQAEVIPDWLVDKFAIAGNPEECRQKIETLAETGIDQIAIIPYGAEGEDRSHTLREFASLVT